jgi:UDP-glucose:(heptosyl)LPS alpha-1,3-glucosyltransferase
VTDDPLPPKRRIGFLIDRWDPQRGGAERALATFAAWLEARGHEVLVFAVEGPPEGLPAPGLFVPVQTHGLTRGARERRLAAALCESARAMGCDLTVGTRHLAQVDFYWPHGGAHAATLRALGKRARGRHRTFLDLERAALADGGARRVICVSELVRQEMMDFYPTCAARLRVVPNGLDLERFGLQVRAPAREALLGLAGWQAEQPEQAAQPVLTFIARQPKLKGLPVLLKALERLQDRPWRLVISGPKDARRWRKRAARQLSPERVFVTPELDPQIAAAGSDLLVLPSRRDTSSLVVLEALASGTPVLVSAAVGAGGQLEHREQGEIFAARPKVSDLADCIARRLGRLQAGEPDRALITQATAGLGLEQWMLALEQALLELSSHKRVG